MPSVGYLEVFSVLTGFATFVHCTEKWRNFPLKSGTVGGMAEKSCLVLATVIRPKVIILQFKRKKCFTYRMKMAQIFKVTRDDVFNKTRNDKTLIRNMRLIGLDKKKHFYLNCRPIIVKMDIKYYRHHREEI